MRSSSLTFFVTLALAMSAAASPVAQRRSVTLRSDAGVEGNAARAFGQNLRAGGSKGKGGKGRGGKGKGAAQAGAAAAGASAGAGTAGAAKAANEAAAAPPAAAGKDPKALQDSLTIDPSVIQNTDDGQNPPVTGQSAADLSKNNFANLCALTLPKVPLTNGLQITTGSCNPIPIGMIPSVDNMPSHKFQSPKNLDTIASGQTFTITLATKGIQLGTFTNAQKTYFGNPQKLNAQGQIIGHTHIVMEAIDSLTTTKVTNPQNFIFFKGVNDKADAQGNVKVDVTGGVKPGVYRMCTIVASQTHQPAIVPIAQHGSLDDCIYVVRRLEVFRPMRRRRQQERGMRRRKEETPRRRLTLRKLPMRQRQPLPPRRVMRRRKEEMPRRPLMLRRPPMLRKLPLPPRRVMRRRRQATRKQLVRKRVPMPRRAQPQQRTPNPRRRAMPRQPTRKPQPQRQPPQRPMHPRTKTPRRTVTSKVVSERGKWYRYCIVFWLSV
ncbi:hypothetical protein DFH08DRAFT_426510 [Mycena albidolilacea]|uniref:Ribosomal protein s17 n=1 Tax=Mycena albidolilacea TaxID=1033008 RepID=A0AAD7EDI4_9AGAR|nr:hypothetical protein DFH08DRAFT_426510 [Mycena albidolilacea]